ncbi:MAG: diacylglycerol kinase family lipid kinase [Bryobacterales bacterium]|nr:diacylglycerol kinase family lipid kinase [Bryobacterales bacterium]
MEPVIPQYRRAILIHNPNAGKVRGKPGLIEAALRALRGQGHEVEARPTNAPGDATRIAREAVAAGADLILVAGGDGTINEALNGMIGCDTPLAVLPAGTANVLARETGIPVSPPKAAAVLNHMQPARIATGLVRNRDGSVRRHFVCMAGAGLDAHIVAYINPGMKRMLGKGAYWIAGFQSITRRLVELDATLPQSTHRCSFALASLVRNYGGDLEIARNASLLAPQFGLYLFEGSNPLRYLKYFTGVVLRNAARLKGITATNVTRLALDPVNGDKVHLQLDGEEAGTLPVTIEVVPSSLTLLLPPRYLAKERSRWTT